MDPQAIDGDTDTSSPSEVNRIAGSVQRRLNGRVRDFRLTACCDGLILLGHAHTYYVKQLAQHLIMAECRLPILANHIEVTTPAG